MSESWLEANLFGVCFAGLVGSALGLLGLTGHLGRLGRRGIAPLALAVMFGGMAVMLAASGLPSSDWLPPSCLAAICAAFVVSRFLPLAAIISVAPKWVASAKMQWAALLIISPAMALSWICAIIPDAADLPSIADARIADTPAAVAQITDTTAYTDAGRPIPLYRRVTGLSATDLQGQDQTAFSNGAYAGRALRTAAPDDHYNCHGWVFTEGRFGIQCDDVETIVHDNGYQSVDEPLPGDLVVYRADGKVTHTGVVLTSGPNQPLLVESKWGRFGRYVHPPEDTPYPGALTYYRSARAGHLLRGLDDTSSPPHISVSRPH